MTVTVTTSSICTKSLAATPRDPPSMETAATSTPRMMITSVTSWANTAAMNTPTAFKPKAPNTIMIGSRNHV